MGAGLTKPDLPGCTVTQESSPAFDGEILPRTNLFTWRKAIDGEVNLTVHTDSVQFDGIWIQLVTLILPPGKRDSKAAVTISDISPNNPSTNIIAPKSGLKTSTRILRGKLKLQFDLDLKGAKVPVTLKSHLGEIQHHLVLVSSTDASWRILDSKIMKTTTGCYDLSLIRPVHARPVRATLVGVRDGRSSSTGPDLEATMQLEKQAYVVGEKITGMIVIENCLKDPILDVTLKITRREFAERGEDFHGIEDVIKTRKLDVPDESTASRVEIDFGMTVPPVYPTWRTPDDTMVISYWIQFTVHTSKMVKVRGEQLIQIGTHYSHNVSQQ